MNSSNLSDRYVHCFFFLIGKVPSIHFTYSRDNGQSWVPFRSIRRTEFENMNFPDYSQNFPNSRLSYFTSQYFPLITFEPNLQRFISFWETVVNNTVSIVSSEIFIGNFFCEKKQPNLFLRSLPWN
jgi:hypothetical protein